MTAFYHNSPNPTTRICTRCHKEKSLDKFDKTTTVKNRLGYREVCKECRHEEYKEQYKPRKQPLPSALNGGKVCRKCLIEKPLHDFTIDKRASDGHGANCKVCLNHWRNVVNKERTRDIAHRCWENHAEEYRADKKQWRKTHKFVDRESLRRRAQREHEGNTQVTPIDYEHILERDGAWCYICEKDILPEDEIEFDHVIPIARHGFHSEENIKVAHKVCNRRKHARLLSEMTPYQRRGMR